MCFLQFLLSVISIHVLREEDDGSCISAKAVLYNFNPRPPRGGRPNHQSFGAYILLISIHVLREEDDVGGRVGQHPEKISIHVLREEDDSFPKN